MINVRGFNRKKQTYMDFSIPSTTADKIFTTSSNAKETGKKVELITVEINGEMISFTDITIAQKVTTRGFTKD